MSRLFSVTCNYWTAFLTVQPNLFFAKGRLGPSQQKLSATQVSGVSLGEPPSMQGQSMQLDRLPHTTDSQQLLIGNDVRTNPKQNRNSYQDGKTQPLVSQSTY